MDDLISRQAAIKDAESWVGMNWYEQHLQRNVVEWLKEFPSAQPEIVLCGDCLFGHICFDIHNNKKMDSWVECTNPDGLYRDVSCDGYCSASIRRKTDETD